MFEFDNAIGETKGHSFTVGIDQQARWVTTFQDEEKIQPYGESTEGVKNVVILFGQTDARKSQLLSVVDDDSLLSNCIRRRHVKFVRVSMYHHD